MAVIGTSVGATAQALKDVQQPDAPLVLKAQGSFFVGGDKVEQTQGQLGDRAGALSCQMYAAQHGAAGRRRQRAGRDGPWRDADREVVGDRHRDADELGSGTLRHRASRVRPRPSRAGTIGVLTQAVFNDARAGSAPAGNLPRWSPILS